MFKNLIVQIDEALHKELKTYCLKNDISMKKGVAIAIGDLLSGGKKIISKIEE